MNRLNEKLKLIFIPFLKIAVCTVACYTFLNWLIIVRLQLFSTKEIITDFWIPFILPFITILIWLRPRIKLLNLKRKRGNAQFGYLMLAALAIAPPLIIAQAWMESASGTLLQLDNIKQIEDQNSAMYYKINAFYIDKKHYGVQPSFDLSGKYNEDFNMHLYVSLPILENKEDTLNSVCFAWIGKEYRRRISNRLDKNGKDKNFREFLKESQNELKQTDFNQFVYLKRLGNTVEGDGFKQSIKNCLKYNSLHSDVFSAVNEPFENHNGNKFAWIFGVFGIGGFIWFLLLLVAKFNEVSVEQFKSGVSASTVDDLIEAMSFLIPREGFFITPIIIDLNILIFMIMVFSGLGFLSFNAADLLNWGANIQPVTTNGQWWRLITCTFLHGGFMHLFANMYGILFIGIFLEPILGKTRYALIYLTSGILASVASIYVHDTTVSVGASGAIFGLYGVFIALLLTKVFPKKISKVFRASTIFFILYNLLMGFASIGIDNAAHVGGLVSGFVIGLIFLPQLRQEASRLALVQPFGQNSDRATSDEP